MGFPSRKHVLGMPFAVSTIALISLFLLVFTTDSVCREESSRFSNPINNIAVGSQHVFVATENCLYQLDHTLRLQTVIGTRKGDIKECSTMPQKRASRDQQPLYYNKLLHVHEKKEMLLSCWIQDKGICYARNLTDPNQVFGTTSHIVSCDPKHPTAGFLLPDSKGKIYLVVAENFASAETTESCQQKSNEGSISIQTNQEYQFVAGTRESSVTLKNNRNRKSLHFVDAFSWQNELFVPYTYDNNESPMMIILARKGDKELEFYGNVDLICESKRQRGKMLSSFMFKKSGGHFWAGIFASADKTESSDKTALCIYNLTSLKEQARGCVYEEFNADQTFICPLNTRNTILPIYQSPTLTHAQLSAVYAIEEDKGMVMFLGTGNGQLLKVILDSNWKANCPEVLYEFKEETPVFHKIVAHPLDNSYIYVATINEIKLIKVANCERFESCKECLSAMDPFCGWCHSEKRCTLNRECTSSAIPGNWIGISGEHGKCLEVRIVPSGETQINITAKEITSVVAKNLWQCQVKNTDTGKVLCNGMTDQSSMRCSCQVSTNSLTDNDHLAVELLINNNRSISENIQFGKCLDLQRTKRCLECISSACLWCTKETTCRSPLSSCVDFAEEATCRNIHDEPAPTAQASPTTVFQILITSVNPERISSIGKKKVTVTGQNFQNLSGMVLIGASSCTPQEVKISSVINNTHAILSLPPSHRGIKSLCASFDGLNCHQAKNIYYESLPSCHQIFPSTTWASAGRTIFINGTNLDFIDLLTFSDTRLQHNFTSGCSGNISRCNFTAPQFTATNQFLDVQIKVDDNVLRCGKLLYKDNPHFTSFAVLNDIDSELELRIKKTHDELNIQENEVDVFVLYANKSYPCAVENIIHNYEGSTVYCKVIKDSKVKMDVSNLNVKVVLGAFVTLLKPTTGTSYLYILFVIPVLLIVIIAAILVTRHKSNQLNNTLSKQLEMLECEIRQEIRDGFAELQIDKVDVTVEAPGTIPFFDYKHYAVRTLFPESVGSHVSEELCENTPSPFKSRNTAQEDESISVLNALFENKRFLVLLIHTLEKQKTFSVKDRCMFASFLTIKLQSNLVYLTQLLEILIRDLMEQASNTNPKLMLRRTESVVEKLLTNWMSTCLYGFLRGSVGEPLYHLVNMLNQRIHKGPIDVVTCKALYTLNEDWLLWQMTDFKSVELNVYFPTMSEDERQEDVSQSITVSVLDCDTIGQAKEKIIHAFLSRKGYAYGLPLCDIGLELHHGQQFKELLDVDISSDILENGITKLNTIKHYKIENGANINVITKKNSSTADIEYSSSEYCHLVSPDSENFEDIDIGQKKGKQKFKVKELYLTKLLSTKVAIHSAVEKLFQSIWSLPNNKPPIAIKHFFDFLDAQAESKKITDQDVMHIWKTNSLPLRFWVHIMKNPQFVYHIKKTPHLDSCLSVIAQAFMDSFSLMEQQLGKAAPTNKLLYAKDIPQFKEEIKAYYKEIRDAPVVSSTELNEFLTLESKKHNHEFKEDVALLKIYSYIDKYYDEIKSTLEKETGLEAELKQLIQVKALLEDKKKLAWE